MKRTFLLSLLTLLLSSPAWGFSATNDDGVTIHYNILSEEDLTCEVTYWYEVDYWENGWWYHRYASDYSGDFVIPETATDIETGETYTVIGIGDYACYDSTDILNTATGLTSVSIPSTVTTIGSCAFHGCSLLTEITIPDALTSIGGYAFEGCSSIAELNIPNSVTTIGNYAFDGCSSLTKVTIGNSVTSIGDYVFDSCI